MNQLIDVQRVRVLLMLVRRYMLLIVAVTIVGAGVGVMLDKMIISHKYSSVTKILVDRKTDTDVAKQYVGQQADADVIETYSDIITSPKIMKDAVKTLRNTDDSLFSNVRESDLVEAIKIEHSGQSQVFIIKGISGTPVKAAKIANAVANSFQKNRPEIMSFSRTKIISPAKATVQRSGMSTQTIIAIGTIVGLISAVIIAFMWEIRLAIQNS